MVVRLANTHMPYYLCVSGIIADVNVHYKM